MNRINMVTQQQFTAPQLQCVTVRYPQKESGGKLGEGPNNNFTPPEKKGRYMYNYLYYIYIYLTLFNYIYIYI